MIALQDCGAQELHTYVVTDVSVQPPKQTDQWQGCMCLSAGYFPGDGKVYCVMPPPKPIVVTFDDLNPCCRLEGIYHEIDFGTGQWSWLPAFLAFKTPNIFFRSGTQHTLTFLNPKTLTSLDAVTSTAGVLTIATDAGESITLPLPLGPPITVTTGFQKPVRVVTITSTSGWNASFDNLTYQ